MASSQDGLKIAPVFRTMLRPRKDTPNLILTLPPELRNRIYQLACTPIPKYPKDPIPEFAPWKGPALLRTCTQIRSEGSAVWYGSNKFMLTVQLNSEKLRKCVAKLQDIVSLCGPRPFSSFRIRLQASSFWPRLEDLLPLLEFMRSSGFEPAVTEYEECRVNGSRIPSDSSTFVMTRKTDGNAQFVLEKALSLARRARHEEWTADYMAILFRHVFVQGMQSLKSGKKQIIVKGKPL